MTQPDKTFWYSFFQSMAEKIIRFRWIFLIAIVLCTTFFVIQMGNLHVDSSNENIFLKDSPAIVLKHKFEEIFGNEDFAYILFDKGTTASVEQLALVSRMADELETGVPYLDKLTWLGNAEYIEGVPDGVEIRNFLDPLPSDSTEIDRAFEKAAVDPFYKNYLISADKQTMGIVLEFENYPEETVNPRREIAPEIRKIILKPEYSSLNPHLVGTPILDYDLDSIIASETSMFMGIAILVQAILLCLLIREPRGVIVPLIIVTISVIWTFGVIAVLGFPINIFGVMIPILLICVGIGDSMHLISEFHDQADKGLPRHEAVKKALAITGLPCLLTSITTVAGFLSFTFIDSKVYRELGIYTATGCLIAFFLTVIIVPLFYSFGNPAVKRKAGLKENQRSDMIDRLLTGIGNTVTHRPYSILVLFAALMVSAFFMYQRLEIESDYTRMISKRLTVRQDIDYVDETMGGSQSIEIMIDTQKSDGIKHPEFLKQVEKLQTYVDNHPITTKTISILDIIKKMRKALHNNDSAFYTIPDNPKTVSQYLFLYETSGGDDLDNVVGFNYDITRVTAMTKSVGSNALLTFIHDVDAYAATVFPPGVNVELAGVVREFAELDGILAKGQKECFAVAFIAICIIMMVVLRSVRLGIISMIPNVFPVFITLGLMGMVGIKLDLALMSFSAVIIGVAVDDTIHFFTRYKNEFSSSRNYPDALNQTLKSTGRPIIFTTIILVFGFAMLAPSAMLGLVRFGLLAGFAFFFALVADFFFAPALILILKPLGPEGHQKTDSQEGISSQRSGWGSRIYRARLFFIVTGILITLFFIATHSQAMSAELTGKDIALKMDAVDSSLDSKASVVMVIEKKGQTLVRKMEQTRKKFGDDERNLITFMSPPDARDTKYLTWSYKTQGKTDDMWVFLPAESLVRRISGGGKKGAFMRSDLANEDIEKREVEDDDHTLIESTQFSGLDCYVVEMIPKVKKDTNYSKRIVWVSKTHWLPVRIDYHNKRGKLFKTAVFGGFEQIDGIWTATKMVFETPGKKSVTKMKYFNYQYNTGLSGDMFDKNNLKR